MENVESINTVAYSCDTIINNIVNYSDNNRTNDDRVDTFENTAKFEVDGNKDTSCEPEMSVNIFRYKFTDDFNKELYKFSKIHQYDERKDFKEAWSIWMEEQDDIINHEIRRLTNLGYDGDILDKMFKSARYYFRKKSTEKKAPKKRRNYMGAQKELLDNMDEHIKLNINNTDYKPSDGFDDFCKGHVDLLKNEVNVLCRIGFNDASEIKAKIKKTYKNRYFLLISK
jgi:hypothetical protein